MVVDPWGRILAEGGDAEDVVIAEIDLDQASETRSEFPALADRVIDAYPES